MQLTRTINMYLLFIFHLLLFMNSHFCQLITGYLFKCVFGFIKSSLHYFVKSEAVSVLFPEVNTNRALQLQSFKIVLYLHDVCLSIFLPWNSQSPMYVLHHQNKVFILNRSKRQSCPIHFAMSSSVVLQCYVCTLKHLLEILHTSFICTQ